MFLSNKPIIGMGYDDLMTFFFLNDSYQIIFMMTLLWASLEF